MANVLYHFLKVFHDAIDLRNIFFKNALKYVDQESRKKKNKTLEITSTTNLVQLFQYYKNHKRIQKEYRNVTTLHLFHNDIKEISF